MSYATIIKGAAGVLFSWVVADFIISLRQKPVPDLPEEFLDPRGLSLVYHYLTEPENIPEGLVISENYIIESLSPSIKYINNRYDCSDFRMQLLFRLYKDCYEKLPESVRSLIKKTCLDFKYWMDEPGEDSMCYWSENHQILFAVSEYLAGQEWPDEIFTNSGMTGAEHSEKAKKRINHWMWQRYRYGFFEWYSNNYYAENIAPISNFIQYSRDKDMVQRMKIVFDILWFDVATHSVNNTYVPVSSRMYGDNKSSDIYGNRIIKAMETIWSDIDISSKTVTARSPIEQKVIDGTIDIVTSVKLAGVDVQMMQNFIAMYRAGFYKVPDVIKNIAVDKEATVIKSSQGLNIGELEEEGLIGLNTEQIMAQFANEAFTNPAVIENSFKFLNKHKLFRNLFLNPFRFFNIKLFRLLGIPKLISSKPGLMTNGIALNRGNVYCYRTGHYTLMTAMAMDVDSCGAQEHIWSANIAPDLAIYTTHPARDDDSRDKHGASPGYWVGNGRRPMSVQDKSVNITIYKIPKKKRLLEFRISEITHYYLPKEKFDKLEFEDKYVFGQRGNVLVGIIANGELKYRPYDEYASSLLMQHDKLVEKIPEINLQKEFDLVREGGEFHAYITELSDTDTESYEEFKERIKKNKVIFDGSGVNYKTNGRELYASYNRIFKIDGVVQSIEYMRFDSKYSATERKPETIVFRHKCSRGTGYLLRLNFVAGLRQESRF